MARPTAVDARPSAAHILLSGPRERRNIFNPLTCAVIGLVAGVCAIVAILDAHPFSSLTASERVSAAVGTPASCSGMGEFVLIGKSAPMYRCTIGSGKHASTQCFAIAEGQVRQIGGARTLRC